MPSVCTLSSRLPLATQAEPWRASAYSEKSEPQCVQCAQCGQGHWLHCIHCAHWEPNHDVRRTRMRRTIFTKSLGARKFKKFQAFLLGLPQDGEFKALICRMLFQ